MIDHTRAAERIASYRAAAAVFPTVRRVAERFDGKCYNKRFSEALKAEIGEAGYIYAKKNEYWLTIEYSGRGTNGWQTIASVMIGKALPDGKRMDAAEIVADMEERRAYLLKAAFEIEDTGRHIEEITARIDGLKKALNAAVDSISPEARDAYGIRGTHYY